MADYKTDVAAASFGRLIGLATDNASPPTETYILPDDLLQLSIFTTVVPILFIVSARILMPDGNVMPNSWSYRITTPRVTSTFIVNLPEGFLLSVTVETDSVGSLGQCFSSVSIVRSQVPPRFFTQMLLQGYTTGGCPLSWPPAILRLATEGRGNIRSIAGTTPAPGTNITETVPLNTLWRLSAFSFQLITSAAAGTRGVKLVIDDGTNVVYWIEVPVVQDIGAGASNIYWFADGMYTPVATTYNANITLPRELLMQPGWRIRTFVLGIDAGDQLNTVRYVVEEWVAV